MCRLCTARQYYALHSACPYVLCTTVTQKLQLQNSLYYDDNIWSLVHNPQAQKYDLTDGQMSDDVDTGWKYCYVY